MAVSSSELNRAAWDRISDEYQARNAEFIGRKDEPRWGMWQLPDSELEIHYAKAIAELDEHDLSMLAAWHASLEVGQPIANRDFLVTVFPSLGDNRREALKIAAGFRGEEAFDAGVAEEQALDTVLPFLSRERSCELASECLELYLWDRLGSDN